MIEPVYDYDLTAILDNEESIAIFLADALETGNATYIAKAIGVVAQAKGIKKISQETGFSHEYITQSLSEQGNLSLKTMLAVMRVLGLEITVRSYGSPMRYETSKSEYESLIENDAAPPNGFVLSTAYSRPI